MIDHSQDPKQLEENIQAAMSFFKTQVPDGNLLEVVPTQDGYDIEYKGVEIGSYGMRKTSFIEWIYGTGLAEPLFFSGS